MPTWRTLHVLENPWWWENLAHGGPQWVKALWCCGVLVVCQWPPTPVFGPWGFNGRVACGVPLSVSARWPSSGSVHSWGALLVWSGDVAFCHIGRAPSAP